MSGRLLVAASALLGNAVRDLAVRLAGRLGGEFVSTSPKLSEARGRSDVCIAFGALDPLTAEARLHFAGNLILAPLTLDGPELWEATADSSFCEAPLVFHTEEEQHLTLRRFTLPHRYGTLVRMGLEIPDSLLPEPGGRFTVLCTSPPDSAPGREAFELFRHASRQAGLSEHDWHWPQQASFAEASVVVVPAAENGLPAAALQASAHARPLLVNGGVPCLAGHCSRSGGGLWYNSAAEFRAALAMLSGVAELGRTLGRQGRDWIYHHCKPEDVDSRWQSVIESVTTHAISRRPESAGKGIAP